MNSTGGKLRKPIGGGAPRISRAEPLATGGTLAARSSLTRARRKLEQNATPAQRGAVTRAKKYAAQSYDRNTGAKTFGRPASVMRKRPPERPAWWGVKGGGALTRTGPAAKAPRITDTLRQSMRALAQSDARFYRNLEKDFGIKIPRATTSTAGGAKAQAMASGAGSVAKTLRAGLRGLAQSDARRLREIQDITRGAPAGTLRGSGSRRQLSGSRRRLPGSR
jgi:hypothetical protein